MRDRRAGRGPPAGRGAVAAPSWPLPGRAAGRRGRRVQGEARAAHAHQQGRRAQGVRRTGEDRGEAHQGGPEDEGDLVECALEGQCRTHRGVGRPGPAGEGDEAGAGRRSDQRHRRARARGGEQRRARTRERPGDQCGDRARVGEREDEDDGPPAVPVREPSHQRPAGHLPEGERTAGEPRGGQGPTRPGDEQHTAEPHGGRGQPSQEGQHRKPRPGQAGDVTVGPQRPAPPRYDRRATPPWCGHRPTPARVRTWTGR
ncbi:hypothetical protein [Streptomyces sp. MK7]|uniref:hypothetical protein n=1 Tax=Streptomyces sp. MK7 TaxID=3067635 RepID=UPI00292EEFAF|nr:hypothetical protein [Streptomyces sp. MK7]